MHTCLFCTKPPPIFCWNEGRGGGESGLTENCEFRKSRNFTFAYLYPSPLCLSIFVVNKQFCWQKKGGESELTGPLNNFPKEFLVEKIFRPFIFLRLFFWGRGKKSQKILFFSCLCKNTRTPQFSPFSPLFFFTMGRAITMRGDSHNHPPFSPFVHSLLNILKKEEGEENR